MTQEERKILALELTKLATSMQEIALTIQKIGKIIEEDGKQDIKENSTGQEENDIEKKVSLILHEFGIPTANNGYSYLRLAIMEVYKDQSLIQSVTKKLYPLIAKRYDTIPSRVERAIRNVIETAMIKGNSQMWHKVFGYSSSNPKKRPSNSEFIAMIADNMRLGLL